MKDNEVKIYSVIVDAEGNDKWLADGVFVVKPKLKTEVKPKLKTEVKPTSVNKRFLEEILSLTGLDKECIFIVKLECNVLSPFLTEAILKYYDTKPYNELLTKTIQIFNN